MHQSHGHAARTKSELEIATMSTSRKEPTTDHHALPLLTRINGLVTFLIGLGLSCWLWLIQNRSRLPSPDSQAGQNLLGQYLIASHDFTIYLLVISTIALVVLMRKSQYQTSQSRPEQRQAPARNSFWHFARKHPLVLALFAVYTVAMVQGTTWMYPELVDWFRTIPEHYLLNNFSIRQDFISETMRRTDYRFFPLAHQDLHILSWLTPYVKVWMLVNAAELFALCIITSKVVHKLSGRHKAPSLLLITSLLLLFHPATGHAFFQFTYCERLLTLVFALYCSTYLNYLENRKQSSFYGTLTLGLLGLFMKDIAIVLFVAPPALMLIAGSLGLVEGRPNWGNHGRKEWGNEYKLELWLCSLTLIFILSFIALSLLPSAFANAGSYNKSKNFLFVPDWRFWFLIGFSLIRTFRISLNRNPATLLDGLNLAAITYASGLLILIGFESHQYLSMPVQWVTVLDLGFVWSSWISPSLERQSSTKIAGVLGSALVLGSIGIDHFQPQNFAQKVSWIKARQMSWLEAYQAIDIHTAPIRIRGETVNLIYSKKSWFSAERHLKNLHFDRLIEFDPKRDDFQVKAGIGKGESYFPQSGDLLFTIDQKANTLQTLLDRWSTRLVYQDRNGQSNGRIYRIEP